MILDATTKTVELLTSAAGSVDYVTTYADHTTSAFTPAIANGNISTATTTTVVAAPASSTQRQVKGMAFTNVHASVANIVRPRVNFGGGIFQYVHPPVTLQPGESLEWHDSVGWQHFSATGEELLKSRAIAPITGRCYGTYKVGTAAEAAAQWYSHAKDSGFPGAWAPGTPGLAGRATDGTAAGDAGCIPIPNAGSGANYLVGWQAQSTVVHPHLLHDVLWVNSGIVVTTTTGQTINSVAWPARDLLGSTNGEGVQIGILVTTATTNAGAITNTTLSYTNQAGTAGRTATIASFPATAVAGTIVWFQLQGGDTGGRSIQTVTLGTSYGGGAISLIASTWLAIAPCTLANMSGVAPLRPGELGGAGVRLYSGVCALQAYQATATTATTTAGMVTWEER